MIGVLAAANADAMHTGIPSAWDRGICRSHGCGDVGAHAAAQLSKRKECMQNNLSCKIWSGWSVRGLRWNGGKSIGSRTAERTCGVVARFSSRQSRQDTP